MEARKKKVIKITSSFEEPSKYLRIGVNCSMLDKQPTGVGVYTYNLVNSLWKLYDDNNLNCVTAITPTTDFISEKVDIIHAPGFLQASEHGFLASVGRILWNSFSYPFWQNRFDIIICPSSHGSFFNHKQIITIHDLLSLKYKNVSRHQRIYFTYLLPVLIKKAKMIIAVSEATKRDIIQFFGCSENKIRVIYNGINNTQYFKVNAKSEIILREYGVQNYFLAVGPTYPHKNFEFLIEAFGNLDVEKRRLHPLVIAGGKGGYLRKLRSLVDKLNLNETVHFIGYVPSHMMANLYREAYALIYPSLCEGFGFPALEAMACGCPVLAARISSLSEVCGEAASYFDPEQLLSLLEAMERILVNSDYRDELVGRGLKQSRYFTWEKTAEGYRKIIETEFQVS